MPLYNRQIQTIPSCSETAQIGAASIRWDEEVRLCLILSKISGVMSYVDEGCPCTDAIVR